LVALTGRNTAGCFCQDGGAVAFGGIEMFFPSANPFEFESNQVGLMESVVDSTHQKEKN